MKNVSMFNDATTYSNYDTKDVSTNVKMPDKPIYVNIEGEEVIPTLLPREYSTVEEVISKIDELDIAIVEEIGRSKCLSSLQVYQLVNLRGFSVQRPRLRKKILKLMRYRVIREQSLKIPNTDNSVYCYELDVKGYAIAKDRGVIFHSGNYYMSYTRRMEMNKLDTPIDLKRILVGNQIIVNMLSNNIKVERFGIMETFCVSNEDGLVTDGSIFRTAATIKVDDDSVLAYEVVRDYKDAYIKLADKVQRYYALLKNERYLISNHHNDTSLPQLIICGESREHNYKIIKYLKKCNLWREEDPILFTEDLLNIKDSARSIYQIKDKSIVWYSLPLRDTKNKEKIEIA